LKPAPA